MTAAMQICSKCKNELAAEHFAPSRRGRAGQSCSPCDAAARRERYRNDPEFREKNKRKLRLWKERNPDRFKAAQRSHYERNKEKMDAASIAWMQANPEKHRAAIARWHKENPTRSYAHTRMRLLRLRGQTPDDADFATIAAIYEESARLTRETGIRHHVDHIIPLSRGGLHHQDNLRVITESENLSKGAKLLEEL